MQSLHCVTPTQIAAEKAYKILIADHAQADLIYDQLSGSQHGKIISTDLARYLDPEFLKEPVEGKSRDLAPSWDHAWRYAQHRFERELSQRNERKFVRFMSGGWGAGKTHAQENLGATVKDVDLIWDGTLADYKWAKKMISTALNYGWKVEVTHVHRNVELALYGAIERGIKEGRTVPLEKLPANHRAVQRCVLNLAKAFHMNKMLSFILMHNTGTPTVKGLSIRVFLKDLAAGGALCYSLAYERYHSQAANKIHEEQKSFGKQRLD